MNSKNKNQNPLRMSEEDKCRLKEAYVKNYTEPETRRLLQQKLAEKKERDELIRLAGSRF